jgi:hypothetical protein
MLGTQDPAVGSGLAGSGLKHLCASNFFCRQSIASLTLRNAESDALNSWPQAAQAATQGAAPMCFTNRMTRFGLAHCDMVKVVQKNTSDETDDEPQSGVEHGFEPRRHKNNHVTGWILKP